jgi:hypothetical protein
MIGHNSMEAVPGKLTFVVHGDRAAEWLCRDLLLDNELSVHEVAAAIIDFGTYGKWHFVLSSRVPKQVVVDERWRMVDSGAGGDDPPMQMEITEGEGEYLQETEHGDYQVRLPKQPLRAPEDRYDWCDSTLEPLMAARGMCIGEFSFCTEVIYC